MAYNFTAEWIKVTLNNAPDALSRSPVSASEPQETSAEYDIDDADSFANIRAISSGQREESIRVEQLRRHAEEDGMYQRLLHLQEGFQCMDIGC